MGNNDDRANRPNRQLTRQQWAIIRARERANNPTVLDGYLPQFRYNRHRDHICYIFGRKGDKYKSLVLSEDEIYKKGSNREKKNVLLYEHPNPNKKGVKQYVINRIFSDDGRHFDKRQKKDWAFHKYDKRKIKKIINRTWK